MTTLPPLVTYKTEQEYQEHYKQQFCRQQIFTFDGIRIHFSDGRFWHAFCTRDASGKKDKFSFERAQYIDWIKPTLEHPDAALWQGWNGDKQIYEPHRRVSIVYQGYIVIVQLGLKSDGTLKGNFITAFYDKKGNTISKIKSAPEWTRDECIESLTGENK